MSESKLRIFGGKDDVSFWSDKPMRRGNPNFKEKWYHIHWYNILYHPKHKSTDGSIVEEMTNINLYKCRCGKCKQ